MPRIQARRSAIGAIRSSARSAPPCGRLGPRQLPAMGRSSCLPPMRASVAALGDTCRWSSGEGEPQVPSRRPARRDCHVTDDKRSDSAQVNDDLEDVNVEASLGAEQADREIEKAVTGRKAMARKYVRRIRRRSPEAT